MDDGKAHRDRVSPEEHQGRKRPCIIDETNCSTFKKKIKQKTKPKYAATDEVDSDWICSVCEGRVDAKRKILYKDMKFRVCQTCKRHITKSSSGVELVLGENRKTRQRCSFESFGGLWFKWHYSPWRTGIGD